MFRKNLNRLIPAAIIIVLTLAIGIYLLISRLQESAVTVKEQEAANNSANTGNADNKKIPSPSDIMILADSSRIYVLDKEGLNISAAPKKRFNVTMDGDMFFNIQERPGKFTIRTRLLKLSVTGKAAFRVIAYNKEDGEEVQTLYGHIVAEKSYKSDFPEPETLRNNNLLMINRTIDLMEKEENQDTRELTRWMKSADSLKVTKYLRP